MNSVSKFEFIGITLSIAVMAGVLYMVRSDTNEVAQNIPVQEQSAGVVVVNEETENPAQALADAIVEAAPGANLQQLIVNDLEVGEGPAVQVGDSVSVHYIGQLQNGQQFDSSYDRGLPFTFEVGAGRVIQGWEQGVVGMQTGGQRVLIIPSDLGYGDNGFGPIPGGATLVFAIELVAIN